MEKARKWFEESLIFELRKLANKNKTDVLLNLNADLVPALALKRGGYSSPIPFAIRLSAATEHSMEDRL
jgi:hypothetical protein